MESGRKVHGRRKVGVLFMLMGLLSGLFSAIAPVVDAAPVPPGVIGNFEIDGDQSSPAGGTIDWGDVDPTVLTDAINPDDGLQGSSKEDEPEGFACQDKSPTVTPGKDNLVRAYINTRVSAADSIFLDLGFVRSDGGTQGDSHVNFEFNQNPVTDLCPYVSRTTGDLLITFDFPGNAADPADVQTFTWDADAPDGSDNPGKWIPFTFTGAVAAEDNIATITDTVVGGTIAPRAFGEASIDLVALAEQTGGGNDGCVSFGFASIRSRSSGQSFESALQDIMGGPVDVTTCGNVIVHKTDDAGNPLAGATFGLWPAATAVPAVGAGGTRPSTGSIDTCTSIADGSCTFDSVDPGDYKVAELSPPAGYDIDPDVVNVTVGFRETVDVAAAFVDPLDTGSVRITKAVTSGGQPYAIDPADLSGLTFILEQGGVQVNTWPPPGVPAECSLDGVTLSCDIGPVPLGSYVVTEDPTTLPDGLSQGPDVNVTIDEDGELVPVTITNPLNPINITLDKLGDKDVANVGDTVNYSFTVATTGVRLHNVTLEEFVGVYNTVTYGDICDSGPTFSAALSSGEEDGFLNAGDAFVWTCPHLVTGTDPDPLPNRAHANGADDFGRSADAYDTFNVDILYPDLQVVKLANDGVDADTTPSANETIDAPGTATYTITVTNVGAGIARNATLTDTLPAGSWTVTQTSANDGNDVCPVGGNPKSGSFTCTFGDLASGVSKTVTVSRAVTIANDCAAVMVNNAGVATTFQNVNIDPNSANNSSSATINVRCPDVGVVKTATNTPISAGQRAEWTITLTNNGAGVASAVFLVDSIPAGLTDPQIGGADAASCSLVGNAVTCSFGDVAPNDGAPGGPDTRVITVSGLTDQADCATIPNTATVASSSQGAPYVDSNPSNNTSTANVVVQCPDLVIDKSTTTGTVSAGQTISFDITVTNNGPGIAFGVTLSDPLPTGAGVSWTENSAQCSITAGVLNCAFGDLASGASASVTLSSATTEASCKTYNNTATADATNDDPVSDSASIVVQCPDLQITKVADNPTTVTAGDQVGFTITVSNGGPGTAFGATLNDPLPAGDGIDWSIQSQSGGASCVIGGAAGAETLTCGPKDLASGASFSVHVVSDTQPTGEICSAATLENTGTADASNDAPVTASASVTIQCPDLQITKVADAASVSAGSPIGFTITVSNGGPGTAYAVTLSDQMPVGVNWTLQSSTAGAGCSLSAGDLLTCGPVDMDPQESFSAHVVAGTTEADCALYENTASADATNDAPVSASDDTLVKCPGLNITKDADDPETVSAGDQVGFTIEVTNDSGEGVGTATGVTLNDPLPAGDGVSWSIDSQTGGAGCAITGTAPAQTLACGPIDLAPGAGFSVHVVTDTDPSGAECVSGTLPNTATADASNHAPITASDTITIQCPDITITKVADDDVVDAGEDIGFTITVSNAGPGTAHGVGISDPLPAGAGVVWTVDPAVEGCTILAGTLLCDVGDLAPEGTFSVHVTGTTPGGIGNPDLPAACKVYDNTATATVANDADETASDSTEVICPLDITIEKDGPDLAHRGDTITYTFTVTNSGEADLVDVVLTDPICDEGTLELVDDADGDTTLAIGEVWTYECTRVITATDPDPLPNTATVVGTDVRDRTTEDTDDHLVDLIAPAIQIVKTVDDATPDIGQTVTFTYVVTNTGDTTLFNVVVVDDQLGPIGTIAELAPGESATLTKTMVVAADSPTRNIATATGADVLGKTVTDDDDAIITIVLPEVIVRPPVAPLPRTGADSQLLLLLSGSLLLLGGLLLASGEGWAVATVRRRRR